MILVVCLDQKDGMSFNRRRQSKDRVLRQKLLELCRGKTLWMSAYSARQFEEEADNIRADEEFLALAGEGEFCFAETVDVTPWLSRAEELIVYRWDKVYPADLCFSPAGTLVHTEEFTGFSHEIILQ